MCVGVPMRVLSVDGIAARAQDGDRVELVDLSLLPDARPILRGEQPVRLRAVSAAPARERVRKPRRADTPPPAAADLDSAAQARFTALKAWRGEVAREHNLPAYVIFHDATLAAIAARDPQALDDLQGISGIGATKLERYGDEVLRVSRSAA